MAARASVRRHAVRRTAARAALLAPLCAGFPSGTDVLDALPGHSHQSEDHCTPELLSRFPGGWPNELDIGIYWFGPGDTMQKAVDGQGSSYYDASKKTVIYFHGWTGGDDGWTKTCRRDTTRCPTDVCDGETHQLLMENWLNDGWNVGFFYWDQFADEDCARDAEQKIWFDRDGDGIRWKSYDIASRTSTYKIYGESAASVADICVDKVVAAMGWQHGEQVRFVGHSIGAQLAVRCAAKLHEIGSPAAPGRLALLEPYFSKHHLWFFRCEDLSTDTGIGDFAADATAVYVRTLWSKYKVVTELYKSSVMTEHKAFGVPNEALEHLGVVVLFKPHWCGGNFPLGNLNPLANLDIVHLHCQHSAAFPLYFLGYGASAPTLSQASSGYSSPYQAQPGSALKACQTPSASCADGPLRQWVERQQAVEGYQKWVQVDGTDTIGLNDDSFKLTPPLEDTGASNLLVMREALSDKAIYEETHKMPWWLNLRSAKLQSYLVVGAAAILGLLGGAVLASCVSAPATESDDGDGDDDPSDGSEEGSELAKLPPEARGLSGLHKH